MNKFFLLMWISVGGIVGTLLRYLITVLMEQNKTTDFPLGTFIINLAGCFVFGFVSQFSTNTVIIRPEVKLALTTGFAGAFTTFSTFIFENYQLTRDSQLVLSFIYMFSSILGGSILLYSGIILARLISK